MVQPPPHASVRWLTGERDRATEERLQKELGVPPILAAVLARRGFGDPAAANTFLNPSLDDLHDPRLLPDFDLAVNAILGARDRKELIFVHGDYDVDGVTSAALFNRFLGAIGCNVKTHVPHRKREGYGIHISAVEAAKLAGARLFLTCDCGIGAHEQIAMAREAGMQVVVTDHHTIGHSLPDATAVVNPHRADSTYPFEDLSGVGVAFKLCQGISEALGNEPKHFFRAFLDLTALGTIVDLMPLLGENRVIAKFGIERISGTKKEGLRALMRAAGVGPEASRTLTARDVSFGLGPRLNAAGRIDDSAISLRLLIENDPTRAADIAQELESINSARKEEQSRIVDQALAAVLESGYSNRNVIVVAGEGWNSGIVGLAASRLKDQFYRPTFVLTIDPDTGVCHGSARSIPGFHLADAIRALPDLMTGGGHAAAAGCTFHVSVIDQVREALESLAGESLTEEDLVPSVRADADVSFEEISMESAESLSRLEPFGTANPEPLFVTRGVTLAQVTPTKNPQHAQVLLQSGASRALRGIAFGMGERLAITGAGTKVDMLLQPVIEEWQGARSLKIHVKDYLG